VNGPSSIDVDQLLRATFVRAVELHDELPSTNDLALERAAHTEVDCPLLIVARRQTAGRGRGQNAWWSSGGGLTFSLLLNAAQLELAKAAWPRASLATGLAVYEAVRELLPAEPLGLKWPNDVYLRERKLCGVLIESPPASRERLVVGVGINVNNAFDGAPEDVRRRGISLRDATGRSFDHTDLLLRVLCGLERCYGEVASTQFEDQQQLAERWRSACLLRGRDVRLNMGSRIVSGRCQGIDAQGALVLQTAAGDERFFGGVVESFTE
jgi:BirA family biotin operon repressor/biotin-[acetyl-CoA-carboxylase] ligase